MTGTPGESSAVIHTAVTVVAPTAAGWEVITSAGFRAPLPREAVAASIRQLRSGQRLHADIEAGRIVRAWIG